MTSKFLIIAAIVFLTFGFQSVACSHNKDDGRRVAFGPNHRVSLVIYFKKNTTNDEVNAFWQDVLKTEKYKLAFQFRIINNGYEGVGINFSTDATPEQRENLKNAIKSSPIVYRVYENVIPKEIRLE